MMKQYLFDASSFINAVKLKNIDVLVDNYVVDLTIYEVFNALWKEFRFIKILIKEKVYELAKTYVNLLDLMKIIHIYPNDVAKILDIALATGLTVYDASYIHTARKHKLVLVTEDQKLKRIARKYIDVYSLNDIV